MGKNGHTTKVGKWIDTYTITFFNKKGNAVKDVEDVYCDMLVDILDYIEGK